MSTAIFLKSYPADFPWLNYALKSIHKFASGFSEVVIVFPEGVDFPATTARVVKIAERGNGYLFQQVVKLYADRFTDADNVVMMDSDTIFNQPVTPDIWFHDGKPIWMMTPMEQLSPDATTAWLPVMTKFCGVPPQFEFMRRIGQCIPRWAFRELRDFCIATHGCQLEEYVMRQPGGAFSEFNCMGFFLYLHHRDRIHWHNTETDGVPPSVVSQFFSHGGITPEIRKVLEEATS